MPDLPGERGEVVGSFGVGSEPGLAGFLGCLGLVEGPEGLLGALVMAVGVAEGLVSPA